MKLFEYTFLQQSGVQSKAYLDLETVVNYKLIKYQEEVEGTLVDKEGFILETKYIVQQPIEVPVEQARTKEMKELGQRNISHSKWELGNVLLSVSIKEPEEVEKLKEIIKQSLVK